MGKSDKASTKSGKASAKSDTNSDEASTSASNSKSNTVTPVYRYKEIKFSEVEVSELKEQGSQPLAYINYNDALRKATTKLLVQSDKIKLSSHGIPSLDKPGSQNKFYPDDSKREFIKIPLDPKQDTAMELRAHLEAADEWAGSDEMRKKLFGKRANRYQYQQCIKTPQKQNNTFEDDDDNDDDDDKSKGKKGKKGNDKSKKGKNDDEKKGDEKKEYPIIDYVKMKFNVVPDGKDGKDRLNKTKLKRIDGKTKTLVQANSIAEIADEIKFHSEIKFIFYYNKIWANKTPAPGASKCTYGLGFKIMAIEYTPSLGKSLDSANIDFLSEEEDEDESTQKTKNMSKNKKAAKMDDDDNEEEEEEDVPKKNVKGKGKPSKKDDDEEEEEDVPKKNVKGKGKPSKKDDDEEEDEDDIPIKKASAKKGNDKKSKKATEEDEEEEEDEEIKPKRKPKGKSTSRSK